MMRQHNWIGAVLFAAALGAPVAEAAPIAYTINFTLISGTEPTAGIIHIRFDHHHIH